MEKNVAYEADTFKEHHLVRLPLLDRLIELGWSRNQIQCPSPDSDDREWRVPKNPSSAAQREKGSSYDGFPVDLALFDDGANKGDYRHVKVLIECKAPSEDSGISELETYMGLEPRVRLGVWTNGSRVVRVYKLPSGDLKIERNATLPTPDENLLLEENVGFDNLSVPELGSLSDLFGDLLDLIVASDGRTTRSDSRLNQTCNLLLLKLESDARARSAKSPTVQFQIKSTPAETAASINTLFAKYKRGRRDLFNDDEPDVILFDDATIHAVVAELQGLDLVDVKPDTLSIAFQVFRSRNLKIGDGQYFTPSRVVNAATKMMCIEPEDKVIDPACGTGGFLSEAFLQILAGNSELEAVRWASAMLYGVDRDDINIKLARALMVGIGDGSTHIKLGDSIRESKWAGYGHGLSDALEDDSYDVVLTNPPFGQNLKLSANEARAGAFSICRHTSQGKRSQSYLATELGIVFVERAYRLLHAGGRLGIVLPETYFFSSSYSWFREWVDERFILKGVLNIPMEAFQGFCRAKTNFYMFVKKGSDGDLNLATLPPWVDGDRTWVSNAPTIGINKDGHELFVIDSQTHQRTNQINDVAIKDVEALLQGAGDTRTSRFVETRPIAESLIGVPQYCDTSTLRDFEDWTMRELSDCSYLSLGSLEKQGFLKVRAGHGSPSADFRNGDVPYIKVSDLRNKQVNINQTNMVPRAIAKKYWRGEASGLVRWDVITPSRASKNIGEPVMLLPGQEDIVLTKEVLVFRAGPSAPFDNFYLAWALMLPWVQRQWSRVVFMQTNREDLGNRWREVEIPLPPSKERARDLSQAVEKYYRGLAELQEALVDDLNRWS